MGKDQVKPIEAKVESISDFLLPTFKTTDEVSWYGQLLQKIL